MSVVSWLLTEHPFFRNLYKDLLLALQTRTITNLDDLVVASRRPVRTALLGLDELIRDDQVTINASGIVPTSSNPGTPRRLPIRRWTRAAHDEHGGLFRRYVEFASQREVPSLVWGQRRLVPESAIERAQYIASWLRYCERKVVFLGDDDLVSPLVAALVPGGKVHVVDIDRGVLDRVSETASLLDAQVYTVHADLSEAILEHKADTDVVVSDPFPSGDGSFEMFFWSHAARILRSGGISVTTVAPSHKPIGYDAEALERQRALGLCLLDLQADFGWYESFDFEFTAYEKGILRRTGLESSIAQTKSILAAQKVARFQDSRDGQIPDMDFDKWAAAAMNHYLTVQAGVDQQHRLATERGVYAPPDLSIRHSSLRADLIAPPELRQRLGYASGRTSEDVSQAWTAVLAEMGITAAEGEITELISLAQSGDVRSEGPLARLGLGIRAMESWERWRLDQ